MRPHRGARRESAGLELAARGCRVRGPRSRRRCSRRRCGRRRCHWRGCGRRGCRRRGCGWHGARVSPVADRLDPHPAAGADVDRVGLLRTGAELEAAAAQLATWQPPGPETLTTITALEDRNLLDLARLLTAHALARPVSV